MIFPSKRFGLLQKWKHLVMDLPRISTNNLVVTSSLVLCYKEENYQKEQNLHIELILLNYSFQ